MNDELPAITIPDLSELSDEWQELVTRLVERCEHLEGAAAQCHTQAVGIVSGHENLMLLTEQALLDGRVDDAQKYIKSACSAIRQRRTAGVSGALN